MRRYDLPIMLCRNSNQDQGIPRGRKEEWPPCDFGGHAWAVLRPCKREGLWRIAVQRVTLVDVQLLSYDLES